MYFIDYYKSPLGDMKMTSDGISLTSLNFCTDNRFYKSGKRFVLEPFEQKELPIFKETKGYLDLYFSGIKGLKPPLFLLHGSAFQMEVWNILLQIPYGKTETYGNIAFLIALKRGIKKMSAQAVGGAVGRNPIAIIVPCHRVIGKNGNLTGYAGGIDKKAFLLRLEHSSIQKDARMFLS